jgi:hypothetical protein
LPSQTRFIRQLLQNYLPTAIGALIEPLWHVLNRHLCVLEPFDSLRRGRQRADDTIAANYNSLPPQLVFWKALKRNHFLVAAVCFMTLLAHLFAVAASGLFFENTVPASVIAQFNTPYSFMFKPLDGSAATFLPNGQGLIEPFYVLTSNATAETPMPSWTDGDWFYLPFTPTTQDTNPSSSYRASTPALRGNLTCNVPTYNLTLYGSRAGGPSSNATSQDMLSRATLRVFHNMGNRTITCAPRFALRDAPDFVLHNGVGGSSAFEFSSVMDATNGSTFEDGQFCRAQIAFGWIRANLTEVNGTSITEFQLFNIDSYEATVINCQAEVQKAVADVEVDVTGRVMQQIAIHNITSDVQDIFQTTASDLLGQLHQFVTDKTLTLMMLSWHNDSFPSDFNQYLLSVAMNSTAFLDAKAEPPTADEMMGPIASQYAKLFAVVIGRNMNLLLEENTGNNPKPGSLIRSEIRIFMSKGLFIIAEAILAMYVIVAFTLYSRRPWRILVRLPTNLASIMAYFAASHAVEDFQSHHISIEADDTQDPFNGVNRTYGFGTFVGTDDKVHAGIERHPYLSTLNKSNTTLTWRTKASERGDVDKQRWKRVEFQASKVKEGGWL